MQQTSVAHAAGWIIVSVARPWAVTTVPVQALQLCVRLATLVPAAPLPAGPRSPPVHCVVVVQPAHLAAGWAAGAVDLAAGFGRFQYWGPGPAKVLAAKAPSAAAAKRRERAGRAAMVFIDGNMSGFVAG